MDEYLQSRSCAKKEGARPAEEDVRMEEASHSESKAGSDSHSPADETV